MGLYVSRARRETPGCGEVLHFNNAGAALMPEAVLDAVVSHLELEARIGGYEAAAKAEGELERVYDLRGQSRPGRSHRLRLERMRDNKDVNGGNVMETSQTEISRELLEAVRRMASSQGRSEREILDDAVRGYIAFQGRDPRDTEGFRALLDRMPSRFGDLEEEEAMRIALREQRAFRCDRAGEKS